MRYFCTISGTPYNIPPARMKFYVEGVRAAYVGDYLGGAPWTPDKAQVKAMCPDRWAQAIDRSQVWHNKSLPGGHIPLTSKKGRYITTIYFQPTKKD